MRKRSKLPVLVVVVSLMFTGCLPSFFEPSHNVSEQVVDAVCETFFWLVSVQAGGPGGTTSEWRACVRTVRGGKTVQLARIGAERSAAADWTRVTKAGKATATGELLMAIYLASDKVAAGVFPRIALGVPDGPSEVDIQAGAALIDLEDGKPSRVFENLEVTLRTVDQGTGSTVLGEESARLTKKAPVATVFFENVVADQPLEIVAGFAGGSVKDCLVLFTVGARASNDVIADLGAINARGGRPPTARAIGAPAESDVHHFVNMGMVFLRADGKVKSSKVPEMVIDLPSTKDGPVNMSAGVAVITSEFEVPKAKYRPKLAIAEVFAVDSDGTETRLARATKKFDETGNASIDFKDVDVPESSDLRVILRISGKRVRNVTIVGSVSAV